MAALRRKVKAVADDTLRKDEAYAAITAGGRRHDIHIAHASGTADNPMSDAAIEAKFMANAAPVIGREPAERARDVRSVARDAAGHARPYCAVGLNSALSTARLPGRKYSHALGQCHETSPSRISAPFRRRHRTAGSRALGAGGNLSGPSGAHHGRLRRGRPERHSARLIGQWLSERLGQQFVVENRSGAGGNVATETRRARARGRLHAAPGAGAGGHQRHALRQSQLQFHPRYRAGRRHFARA